MLETLKDIEFARPWVLWLLATIPLLLLGARRKVVGKGLRVTVRPAVREFATFQRSHIGFAGWLGLSLALGVIALARPQNINSEEKREFSGIEVMLALDVSPSMTGDDFKPDRLTVAKQLTKEFIASRPNDRIGMVAFSGRPYPIGPLTLDHQWLNKNIDDLQIGYQDGGTAIGPAIASAASRIDKRDAKSKIIVLITDGANNVRDIEPLDAARAASLLGIKIYTIAIGTTGTINIKVPGPFGRLTRQRMNGEFDIKPLIEIAKITGGEFYKAGSSESLADAFETINDLERTTQTTTTVYRVRELFHWFAIPSLIALLIGTIIPPLDERAAAIPRPTR